MSDEPVDRVGDTDLEEQLCALEHLDLQGLQDQWLIRWGTVPKLRSTDLLRRIIAWRLQAREQGGLGPNIRARLRSECMPRIPLPAPGTRLTRRYKGVLHTVEVGAGNRTTLSLSPAAFKPGDS